AAVYAGTLRHTGAILLRFRPGEALGGAVADGSSRRDAWRVGSRRDAGSAPPGADVCGIGESRPFGSCRAGTDPEFRHGLVADAGDGAAGAGQHREASGVASGTGRMAGVVVIAAGLGSAAARITRPLPSCGHGRPWGLAVPCP